jgi:hypothetical protein
MKFSRDKIPEAPLFRCGERTGLFGRSKCGKSAVRVFLLLPGKSDPQTNEFRCQKHMKSEFPFLLPGTQRSQTYYQMSIEDFITMEVMGS